MELLKGLGIGLMLPSGGILVWDLVYFWFVKNDIKVRTTAEWLKYISANAYSSVHNLLTKFLPGFAAKIEAAPFFLTLFVPGVSLYILYRLVFLLAGGKPGGYKSRH